MLKVMLSEAFRAIIANRLRTFLTMLGLIIGVMAVVLMLAVGQGVSQTIKEDLASLGSNLLVISPASTNTGGVRSGSGNMPTLTLADTKAIKELPGVAGISPLANNNMQLVVGNRNWHCKVLGVYPAYLDAYNLKIISGRPIDDIDETAGARVVLIGQTLVKELFLNQDPIGKIMRIGSFPFTVIGVLQAKGQTSYGDDQDDTAIIPYASSRRFIYSRHFSSSVRVLFTQAESEEIMDDLTEDIRSLLRERHRLTSPDQDDDFYIQNMTSIVKQAEDWGRTTTILLGAIASISLVVGGIGIMNIMLVSVTERTREIGIKLAIGARQKDILTQFVLEAMLVSVTGGLIGIILGVGGAMLVEVIFDFKVLITLMSLVLSFSVSAAIGLFFGFYPAWKAARQNPIDALRYQ